MAIDVIKRPTKEEVAVLDNAINDFFDTGRTTLVCPRCKNEYEFSKRGSSYQIKCKTEDCLELTSRGI